MPFASFVVAETKPAPRLIEVDAGDVRDRSDIGRAWAGDAAAYNIFQQRYANDWQRLPDAGGLPIDASFRLTSSMQFLLHLARVPTVGGYLTRVGSARSGFRYMADPANIGPEEMDAFLSMTPEGDGRLRLEPVAGGDRSLFLLRCAAGVPPTFGALAYLAVPPGAGVLFRHEQPHVPVPIRAESMDELVERAKADHGQTLQHPGV